jgi:hypothetical protein
MPSSSRSYSPPTSAIRFSADSWESAAAVLGELEARVPLASLAAGLGSLWRKGWQPLDAARLMDTVDERVGRRVLVDALLIDRERWHQRAAPLWAEQAERLGATTPWWDRSLPYWAQVVERLTVHPAIVIRTANTVHDLLVDPPPMPSFEAPPTEPARVAGGGATDPTVLARVRALLAKAESTTFEAEADALTAKAQELIARHAIDVALLGDVADVPGGRRILIERPYARAKYVLLSGIARANHCRACWHGGIEVASVIGHSDDLHLVEVLYTSLLVQGTSAVLAASRRGEVEGSTRAWRNAFWTGFANRVGQRLAAATAAAQAEHAERHGDDLLPVLAARKDAVDRAFAEAFPRLGKLRTSVSSGEGLLAGHRFADKVRLDGSGDIGGGGRRAIGR